MAFSDDLMEAALAALKIDFSAKGSMFTVNERNILGIHLGLSLKKYTKEPTWGHYRRNTECLVRDERPSPE